MRLFERVFKDNQVWFYEEKLDRIEEEESPASIRIGNPQPLD